MDGFVGEEYRLPGVLVMSHTQYRHLRVVMSRKQYRHNVASFLCCLLYQCSCEPDKVSPCSCSDVYSTMCGICIFARVRLVIARMYESCILPLWYMVYLAV